MSGDDNPEFERVDWTEVDRSRTILTAERATLVVSLLIVGGLYLYDQQFTHLYLVGEWSVDRVEWVFLVALGILVAYVGVPLYKNRERTRRVAAELRSSWLVTLAVGYLAVFFVAGVLTPVVVPDVPFHPGFQYNPPVGLKSTAHNGCAGVESYQNFRAVCRGSLRFPLGTGGLGVRVEHLIIAGARPALYVLVIGGLLIVPIATVVGVAAGLRGGLVDKLLLTYVDLQLSIPTILIYFVAFLTITQGEGASLLLFLAAFGLLSWGGLARLIRSEVIQRRGRGHVTVARSLGASESYVARRHIVPNITNTLLPAVAHVLALLLLYEAGLAFLGFYDFSLQSWGATIGRSVDAAVPSQHIDRPPEAGWRIWWVSTFPALALTLTMLSLKVVGDALRDALDPRGEQ